MRGAVCHNLGNDMNILRYRHSTIVDVKEKQSLSQYKKKCN